MVQIMEPCSTGAQQTTIKQLPCGKKKRIEKERKEKQMKQPDRWNPEIGLSTITMVLFPLLCLCSNFWPMTS
jgi:hypothetical protein